VQLYTESFSLTDPETLTSLETLSATPNPTQIQTAVRQSILQLFKVNTVGEVRTANFYMVPNAIKGVLGSDYLQRSGDGDVIKQQTVVPYLVDMFFYGENYVL